MFHRPDMRILLLVIFLLSISTNPVFALFGISIKEFGGKTALLGATSAVAAMSEFPVMFVGSRLTKRLGSRSMFIVALSIYSVRVLL